MDLNPIPDFLVDLADLGQPCAHVRGEPVEQALDVGEGLQPQERRTIVSIEQGIDIVSKASNPQRRAVRGDTCP